MNQKQQKQVMKKEKNSQVIPQKVSDGCTDGAANFNKILLMTLVKRSLT